MKTIKRALLHGMYDNPRTIGGPSGLLARMVPFESTTKNFRAERRLPTDVLYGGPFGFGWLSAAAYKKLYEADPIYIVWCYNTPVAWVPLGKEPYVVVREDMDDWSLATTRHVGMCSAWLGVHKDSYETPMYMRASEWAAFEAYEGQPEPFDFEGWVTE